MKILENVGKNLQQSINNILYKIINYLIYFIILYYFFIIDFRKIYCYQLIDKH